MTKLNEFISSVRGGMAKTTHFEVRLTLPPKLTNNDTLKSNLPKIILFCDQAQLPGISYGTAQVRSYGEFKEVPYEKLYEAVNLNFYVDVDMHVRTLFDTWVNLVQNPKTRDFNWANEYTTDSINIIIYDSNEAQRYICTLHKAYPKAISAVQLDYSSKEIMKLQVAFSYQYATFQQMLVGPGVSGVDNGVLPKQTIADFNYGYENIQVEIPTEYINEFNDFQTKYNQLTTADLSLGGVRTSLSLEDVGVKSGFGGIFG